MRVGFGITGITGIAAFAAALVGASVAGAGEPPSISDLRVAFEAQFPKSEANGTALELERLSAALGIDLAPRAQIDPEKPDEPPPVPKDGRARPAPNTENRLPLIEFLQRELAVTNERIGRGSPVLEQWMEEHGSEISRIEGVLLGGDEPRWEVDVAAGAMAPTPNFLGLMRLQRLLMTRALFLAREGDGERALQAMEASWRLQGAVLSRPEIISQLIAVAIGRFQAGVLRKIDSPAFGWPERLRGPGGIAGMEAALANQTWYFMHERKDGTPGPYGRAWRGFVDILERQGACAWSSDSLGDAWREAAEQVESEEERLMSEISAPNQYGGLLRARRVAVDSELTALIIDARIERAAMRRPRWPGRLLTLNAGVCPEAKWTYRVDRDGTARFAFATRIEEDGSPYRLPLEFIAGKPLVRRPARKGVVVNPPPPPSPATPRSR